MKKVITVLIILAIYTLPVRVSAYITDFQEEKREDTNAKLINTEIRFKWYKENTIYSEEYYVEGDNPLIYPYKVENDYTENTFSNWSEDPVLIKPNRIIEERMVYKYHELKPIRYIYFKDIMGGFTTFRISELNILIKGVKINYDITCNNCSANFGTYIKNGNIDEDNVYVSNNGDFKIDLNDYYSVGDLRMELYMYDPVPNTKKCKIYMNDIDMIEGSIVYKQFETYVVSSSITPERYLFILDNSWISSFRYTDWIYVTGFSNNTYYRQTVMTTEKRYKDIKYRYYGIEREYADNYYSENPGDYIKDEEEFREYYQYEITESNNEELDDDSSEETDSNIDDNIPDNDDEEEQIDIIPSDSDSEIPDNEEDNIQREKIVSTNIDNHESINVVEKVINTNDIKEETIPIFIKEDISSNTNNHENKKEVEDKKNNKFFLIAGGSLFIVIIIIFLIRRKTNNYVV